MRAVFLPERGELFFWGDDATSTEYRILLSRAKPRSAELIVPPGRRQVVRGLALRVVDAVPSLAMMRSSELDDVPPSVAIWALASKLVWSLSIGERLVPCLVQREGSYEARWRVTLDSPDDVARVKAIAASMPPAAHAVPFAATGTEIWSAERLLVEFLDSYVDENARIIERADMRRHHAPKKPREARPWEDRWMAALHGPDASFRAEGFGERTVIADLQAWSAPVRSDPDRLRACFRLEPPAGDDAPFTLRFLLQAPSDPSLLFTAEQAYSSFSELRGGGRVFHDPEHTLFAALGPAARLFVPIHRAYRIADPTHVELDATEAWGFLQEGGPALAEAGFGVIVPGELTAIGARRLRLRMRVRGRGRTAGVVQKDERVDFAEFDWQAAIGDDPISAGELAALAASKAPLVRHHGAWVVVDPTELAEIRRRLAEGRGRITTREAIIAALTGTTTIGGLTANVVAEGQLAGAIARLRAGATVEATPPTALRGTLRPYQARGVAWLQTMSELGFGACLADDMGLGKTIQSLAFLLGRRDRSAEDPRPALLVAPTSVLGNWAREIARFAPDLEVVHHYGSGRARLAADVRRGAGTLIITSYGLLRRDARMLAEVDWSTVILDEAQNIKNAEAATARAARGLRAAHRIAMTGTPVENRLAELWSIYEFLNPGLLGRLGDFRSRFAVPIERFGSEVVAEELRRITAPFLLRRVKSDPAIVPDLPAKQEMKVITTLTREQATLYRAVVDDHLERIEQAEGIERRGRVLTLLMRLKQLCNHPAQYLGETGPLPGRSGKLARLAEMLDEALGAGDRALVFTQFREMGDLLVSYLATSLGAEVQFLHGGTPRAARDEMVRRFQEESRGPRVFILSLKAGGTGLNLTAANHVFHYDRWWNPAVEDQATDRAYRIGQTRGVQVHKFVCAGTVEDKIDQMLEKKRGLAARIVGAGEQWITELADAELRELFSLSGQAVIEGGDDDPPPRRGSRAAEARP